MGEWIEWSGGECPVDGRIRVDVRYREETALEDAKESGLKAHLYSWLHDEDADDDIIAYRLHKPAKPASAWIKCSDRMPDVEGSYLCWDDRSVGIYQWTRSHWVANHFGQFRVTHWQPLPSRPEA